MCGRERDGTRDARAGALRRLDDVVGRLVEELVIERLEANADLGGGSHEFVRSLLLEDLGDDAGADGAAAFADGEAHLLLERDRRDELDRPS